MANLEMNTDTICAISTAPGVGGIAVARVSGPRAIEIADRLWHSRRRLHEMPSHTCALGTLLDTRGEALDSAVATVFRAPASFTGDDVVELGVHGSAWVQRELILALIGAGARLAEPGEFSRRAFAAGKMDLAQTEAVADLIASTSRAAHRMALSGMRGDFSKRIEDMRRQLVELAALLELELDFSEEDVEFASRERLTALAAEVRDSTARLADGFAAGQAIRTGVPVAIVGATNAGKSSILNALAGDDRAIVSDIHGTTRDVVEDTITVGDYTLRLSDTAGFRDTADAIEAMGIERSRRALGRAAIILLVVDTTAPDADVPWQDVVSTIKEAPDTTLVVAANKCDLTDSARVKLPPEASRAIVIPTSAATGAGIDSLRDALANACRSLTAHTGDTLVANARHHQALRDASAAAARTVDALNAGIPGDLVAQDLRACIDALASITGAISTPEILATIFSRFCVGK